MAKPKGSLKTGGRVKGIPNKRTLVLKSVTEALGLDVPNRLVEILPQLEPEKQADILLELMNYIYPKRKAIEHSGPAGGPIQIEAQRSDIRKLIEDPEARSAIDLIEKKLSNAGE